MSGGARDKNGRWYANIRFGDNERLEFRVPSCRDEAAALARAAVMSELAEALVDAGRRDLVRATVKQVAEASTDRRLTTLRKVVVSVVEGATRASHARDITLKQWGQRYTSGELSRLWPDHVKAKDWGDDVSRLDAYIYPHVGDVPVVAFSFEHASLVLAKLPPEKVRREATRRHVAQIMGRLMHIAVFPGKLIIATPLPRGWLPKITDRRHYSCLFPREERLLLEHAGTPAVFRLFCGVLNREGMRLSELLDSDWGQWNLHEGTFLATKTKTDDPRFWAIRPDVADAMREWKKLHGNAPPFAELGKLLEDRTKIAEYFRRALAAAGIDRKELFATTAYTGRLRAHDMRATFVTTSLASGKSETWIRDRTAHRSTSMIDRYRRTARQFVELNLGPLGDLAATLGWRKAGGNVLSETMPETELSARKYRRRDSNPHALRAADFESAKGVATTAESSVFSAENDVARRRGTAFHQLSTTPTTVIGDSIGGPDGQSEPSTEGAGEPPINGRGPGLAKAAFGEKVLAHLEAGGTPPFLFQGTGTEDDK